MSQLIFPGGDVKVTSPDIKSLTLVTPLPFIARIYVGPWLVLYPLAAYAFYGNYDKYIGSIEWSFLLAICLYGGHALSFLGTRWSIDLRSRGEARHVNDLRTANRIKILPHLHRGKAEIVQLERTNRVNADPIIFFSYQRDTYQYSPETRSFARLSYPCDSAPTLDSLKPSTGLATAKEIDAVRRDYGKNIFDIPVPTFAELFAEHAVAPFFVFQVFCVGLWCLDDYWYYSLFTLFMLIVFECTTVFQRLRTVGEFRSMSIKPYPINVRREGKWVEIQTDELLPGDVVSIVRTKEDSGVPCDLLLLKGSCIVNEAMLSGESTPLLKESIELRDGGDKLDIDGADRNSVLFGGTKVLQSTGIKGKDSIAPPDDGCLAIVLRTGFGTSQGQLIRTMIFSTETVSANNLESFLFIAFLLVFALAASAYVWTKGVEQDRKRSKLLLDCVIIITSVVPPELPMELSMAVNASLVALSKYSIFCTEPFRIPFAGRVDVCCFDKTGTITGENLVVEGVVGVDPSDRKKLIPVKDTALETTLCLASAHALVLLDDGVVGDPMEKTTLDALEWKLSADDKIAPLDPKISKHAAQVNVRRRFQFSSLLKRMSTISTVEMNKTSRVLISVKGAPETLKTMFTDIPAEYEATYKWYAQRGSRVLALGYKYVDSMNKQQMNAITRDQVESQLQFAGFLVFHCPLKPDAIQTIKDLNDSSHRCVMITGDNPLTAAHVAKEVEIVDREVLILDQREGSSNEADLTWRTPDEKIIIPVNPEDPIDKSLFAKYDICMTGVALRQFADRPAWLDLVQNTWVYARVSPSQKEFILTTLKSLGYITLMAGDGTNDVGALKQANIGVALLNGTEADLKAILEHQQRDRAKKVYEAQLKLTSRFKQPPPPVPPILADLYPDVVAAQKAAADAIGAERKAGVYNKFDVSAIADQLTNMEDDQEVPQIKLGDASVAAPFTSKLANVVAIVNIIRQGRCTLVATIQMYKILALNCLISAWALSVQYLQGIKFGDYQVTITGILMSVCFMCISRARPVEKLSKERPLATIFNFYVVSSILLQFAIHVAAFLYLTDLCEKFEPRANEPVDLEAKFSPNLLNSCIYLISLSQQVSTFAINFQGRPFREGITENSALYYGLLGVAGVAFSGASNFFPEFNRWLQLVDMETAFRTRMCITMILDYGGAWLADIVLKALFADNKPKEMVTRGVERREARRAEEARLLELAEEQKKDLASPAHSLLPCLLRPRIVPSANMVCWIYIGPTPDSFLICKGSYLEFQGTWNGINLQQFTYGPAELGFFRGQTLQGFSQRGPTTLEADTKVIWYPHRFVEHCSFTAQGGYFVKYNTGGICRSFDDKLPPSFAQFLHGIFGAMGPSAAAAHLKCAYFGLGDNWIVGFSNGSFTWSDNNTFPPKLLAALQEKQAAGWALEAGTVLSFHDPRWYFVAFKHGNQLAYNWEVEDKVLEARIQDVIEGKYSNPAVEQQYNAALGNMAMSQANTFSNSANIAFGGPRWY
ncbi:cation-transporting ATPase 4 [Pseudohyphozyma bogoriensis]|nr:cation-transporting ATPase 4 [Pseudohyphozyma bogoriensis]